jgi:hypothetical protein
MTRFWNFRARVAWAIVFKGEIKSIYTLIELSSRLGSNLPRYFSKSVEELMVQVKRGVHGALS